MASQHSGHERANQEDLMKASHGTILPAASQNAKIAPYRETGGATRGPRS